MDNKEVARVLTEIGTLLELRGENPFKSRAYYNAALSIEKLGQDVNDLVKKGELSSIKGLGEALVKKITELAETGRLGYYDELKSSLPPGLSEMLSIHGLGPKKIRTIHEKLGITTIGELEYACTENRLVELPGFGVKTQEKILKGILQLKSYSGRHLYSKAVGEAEVLVEELKKCKDVTGLDVAGELRRKMETVGRIEIMVSSPRPEAVIDYASSLTGATEIKKQRCDFISFALPSGIDCIIRTANGESYPHFLRYYTGSETHNKMLAERASKKGLGLTESGVFKDGMPIPCPDEEAIFRRIGLDYIPPELREGTDEIESAERGSLPKLITGGDIRGVLHVHTAYSDGINSIEEMAEAAQRAGYSYLGVADHSRSVAYAGGLSVERLKEQGIKIDELNRNLTGIKLLKGAEVDILPDGSLDYPDEVLSNLDFVIVSVHSKFNMSRTEMTERIIRAMENSYVGILAHPTGRLLLSREGYAINLAEIIEAARRYNVAIELNSNPRRLELDWRYLRQVKEAGVKVAVNPDAHRVEGLSDMAYGVGIARKGWIEAADVINTMSVGEVLRFFKGKRSALAGC